MEEALKMLRELRAARDVCDDQLNEFIQTCDRLGIPSVTLYTPAACEGWYQMFRVYVFSTRTDIKDHVWYYSPYCGEITVLDAEGKNGKPFKEWSPDGDLFFDPSLDEGGTNMDPVERERLHRTA